MPTPSRSCHGQCFPGRHRRKAKLCLMFGAGPLVGPDRAIPGDSSFPRDLARSRCVPRRACRSIKQLTFQVLSSGPRLPPTAAPSAPQCTYRFNTALALQSSCVVAGTHPCICVSPASARPAQNQADTFKVQQTGLRPVSSTWGTQTSESSYPPCRQSTMLDLPWRRPMFNPTLQLHR